MCKRTQDNKQQNGSSLADSLLAGSIEAARDAQEHPLDDPADLLTTATLYPVHSGFQLVTMVRRNRIYLLIARVNTTAVSEVRSMIQLAVEENVNFHMNFSAGYSTLFITLQKKYFIGISTSILLVGSGSMNPIISKLLELI